MKNEWKADDECKHEMSLENEDPVISKIAPKWNGAKEAIEKAGVCNNFEAFDSKRNDPVHRLRTHANKIRKGGSNKKQRGGFVMAPWLIALLATAGAKTVEKVVDFIGDKIRNKVEGKGFREQMEMLSPIQKKKYLINMLKR